VEEEGLFMNLREIFTAPLSQLSRQLFAPQPTELPALGQAAAVGPAQVVGVPVDDMGREMIRPRQPMVGGMFMPRVRDRLVFSRPPWSQEQMAAALRLAELGDMSQQAELMEYMEDTDGELLGYMQTRRLAQCGLKWSIEAANDTKDAEAIAKMVRAEIAGIPNFPIAFRNMQDAIGKGVSALWIDWQPGGRTQEANYRINGIHHISAKRYRFHWAREEFLIVPDDVLGQPMQPSPLAGTMGHMTGAGIGVQPLPWKVIVHRTQIKAGHPAKAGVLRLCALYFFLRQLGLKDAAVYCEIFGMPGRIFKYPDNMDDLEKAELAAAAEQYGTDMVAIISKAVEAELLESTGKGNAPYFDLHGVCGFQMQMAICGQDQTNTHNAAGGRTQVKEGGGKIRQDLMEADCIDSQTTLTQQLCYPIVGFSKLERPTWDADANTWRWPVADELCPKFKLHYEPPGDFESMIAVDVPLYTVLRLPVTMGYIAKRYESPLPDGVDPNALLEPAAIGAATQPQGGGDGQGQGQGPGGVPMPPNRRQRRGNNQSTFARDLTESLMLQAFAPATPGERAQSDLDDLGDRAADPAGEAFALLGDQIRKIVRKATRDGATLPELRQRLLDALPDLDASDFETIVRRGLFISRLHGRATAIRKVEE
jgi:phage gp29-like protein